MSSQLVGIADRYDRELAGVTDETLKRIFAAYDTSYRNLVKNLRDAFPRLEQAGSISTLVRQGAIAAELGEALKFINPEAAKELERLGRDTIQQAGDLGQQMAGDALNYVGVQSTFTTVPVGAVRNQAERFRERLVNYSDQQASSISAVVEQGLIQGWGTRKIEGQLRGLGVSFKSNAETVARTETLSAYNGAARSRYEQAGVAYIQWIATPAEGTCSLCYARNTKVWKITEAPSVPAHPRCLPGDTLIFSTTIQGSASRQYTGQIVTIQTTSGKKLTATPNHPVFTDNGWIPLNQITEGDYVFSSIGAEDAVRLISPDNYQRPALISEVVRSFRESTGVGSVSMKVSPEYFHGDGEGSDVCVVSTNGLLRNDGYTETLEPFSHQHFIRRLVRALELLSPGLSAFLSPRQRPSLHSLMSVFNLPSPGGRIHSAPLNSLSLRLASDVHTSISQYQPDSGSLDAICLCESVFGLPLNISDNNQVPYISIGSTNSGFTGPVFEKLNLLLSALYSPPLNFAKQPLTVQPELSSSSLNRLSGKVKRDRVVNVRVSHFEGTVYNIETQTGWYFANSILTHNCRCTTLPVSSLDQIDTAFYESYSQDGLDDLARQKLQPDNGLTYWEKKAGATLAKPAWVPGQVIPKAEPVKAKRKPAAKKQVAPPKKNQPYFDKWSDSYKDAPKLFRRVIEQFDYPGEIPSDGTEGAYQRAGTIHMGSFEPGIGRADSVWRHEYGHYIDYLIGRSQGGARSPIGYFSSSPEGIKAMSSDRKALNKAKDIYEDMRSLDYDKWFKLNQKARVSAFVSSDYKSLLKSAPSVFKEIDKALNAKDSDFARETIAAAILTKDPERFIRLAEEALKTRYQGKSPVVAADLAGAITRNNIGYGHEDDYYNDPGLQETEAFANVFSMISSGNKLESEIAKYIAPTFSQFVEDTLSQFLSDTLKS